MAKDLAVILNSGSIESAITTSLAAQRYRLVLLHVDVGHGQSRRRAAYEQQVAHFKPYREHVLAMPFLAGVGEAVSASVGDPRVSTTQLGPQLLDLLPLLAVGFRFAAHYQAAALYSGLRVGGSGDEMALATEYGQIWNELIQMPCGLKDLEVLMPLLELEPWQMIDVGFQVEAPFDKTWSCLEESSDPCWACHGCRGREKSFQQAGKVDPMRIVKKG